MTIEQRFFEYAVAFEETYVDDDWTRLEPFFADDAVYEVRGDGVSSTMNGRDAVLRGMRKSIDGFDRQCERRVELDGAPVAEGDTITVRWKAHYRRGDAPPLTFAGTSVATIVGGRVVRLVDTGDWTGVMAWIAEHAPGLDPSYD